MTFHKRTIFSLTTLILVLITPICQARQLADYQIQDTPPPGDTVLVDTTKRKGFFNKIIGYFADANTNKKKKKFDFSIIGGPHYSSDVKVGLGIVASGLYRMDANDSIMPPSNVSIFGDISTTGFYMLGVRGNNLFPKDRFRIDYTMYTFSFPSAFWGIGYQSADNDANISSYKRQQFQMKAAFMFKITPQFYIGPSAGFDFVAGHDIDPTMINHEDEITRSWSIGGVVVYDSRDNLTSAYKGIYAKLEQRFTTAFHGKKNSFFNTTVTFDMYHQLWRNSVLAFDAHGEFNYGNHTPWTMLAKMGGSYRMRGYYEGRYRDNNMIEIQLELRQRIWRRIGATAWVGAGNVFKDSGNFRWQNTLPNYGLGLRWEFKNRVNVRLDYGFGKNGQGAFLFQINEAF